MRVGIIGLLRAQYAAEIPDEGHHHDPQDETGLIKVRVRIRVEFS